MCQKGKPLKLNNLSSYEEMMRDLHVSTRAIWHHHGGTHRALTLVYPTWIGDDDDAVVPGKPAVKTLFPRDVGGDDKETVAAWVADSREVAVTYQAAAIAMIMECRVSRYGSPAEARAMAHVLTAHPEAQEQIQRRPVLMVHFEFAGRLETWVAPIERTTTSSSLGAFERFVSSPEGPSDDFADSPFGFILPQAPSEAAS